MNATSFAPEDVALMGVACDEAWTILKESLQCIPAEDQQYVRSSMAARVMDAMEAGVRDPARLQAIALG